MTSLGITLAQAQRVLQAALAKADEIGHPMNVAVVDAGAHLVAFGRQDGSLLGSIDIAIRKASSAVLLQMPTATLAEAAAPGAPLFGIEVTNGGMVIFGGGIPIHDGDRIVGAVGVSAGSVEQDVEVAEAGVAAYQPA